LPVDLGDVNSEGFVVEHRSHTRVTRLTCVAWHVTEISPRFREIRPVPFSG
jgi:hypothetical protein